MTVDLIGQTFTDLVVIGRVRGRKCGWLCRCICGEMRKHSGHALKSGIVKSCGCRKKRGLHVIKHGLSDTPEHRIWWGMIDRCTNPKKDCFHLYGGRGIKVCERWRNSFEAFLADVGPRPSKQHSLDRHPDKNGNYEPGNVRWATSIEQNNNTRRNRPITFRGQTMNLAQWARAIGIPVKALGTRLDRGWPTERAFTQPHVPRR